MLLFMCTQLWAAEPSKEVMIASVNQETAGSVGLGTDSISSVEIAGSYGLSEKISVLASYGYGGITTSYGFPNRESTYDYYESASTLESAFGQHMISIGPRYRYVFNEWASIYGKVEGSLAVHTLRFAPSISDEDPVSKVNSMGISFGGAAALGLMGSIQLSETLPDIFVSLEMGYNFLSTSAFDSLGELDVSGGYSSLGCGLRF